MNRGSSEVNVAESPRVAASMRPRFMNRGSTDDTALHPAQPFRFNEAPIHESGKSLAAPRPRPRSGRFNEAPIHESGKSR